MAVYRSEFSSQGKGCGWIGVGLQRLWISGNALVEVFEEFCAGYLVADFTFPKADDMPIGSDEGVFVLYIPCFVGLNLGFPKLGVGLGGSGMLTTFMPVPKTAVNKDSRFVFGQHDIGCAGKFAVTDTEAQAFGKKEFSHQHLGFGVLAVDCRHAAAPLLRCHRVGHILFSTILGGKNKDYFLNEGNRMQECRFWVYS